MKSKHLSLRHALLLSLMVSLTLLSTRLRADTGTCGGVTTTLPFTDVMGNGFFCQIAAAYFSGLTNGTSATTYSPANNVTREQMAAFTTRTLDQSLKRGNPRAALGEWWTDKAASFRYFTLTNANNPRYLACDGQTVWVSNTESNSVSRVDINTGKLICTLTGVPTPEQLVIVSGFVYVTSFQAPGKIYKASIQETFNGTMAFDLNVGNNPVGITYDGENLWTANAGTGPGMGSITRVGHVSLSVTTFTAGFSQPVGILFDGTNLWVTDAGDASLKRVDINTGAVILPATPLSGSVSPPIFDGTNLWIPCGGPDKVFVVRGGAASPLLGSVLAQLTGNGLNGPFQAAFDGERICVTNVSAQSVSLWKATDLSPLGAFNISPLPTFNPRGVCSDGTTFFIGMRDQTGNSGFITRF